MGWGPWGRKESDTAAAAAAPATSLQSCPTLCDPIDAAYQAPPSMGFSRQETTEQLTHTHTHTHTNYRLQIQEIRSLTQVSEG